MFFVSQLESKNNKSLFGVALFYFATIGKHEGTAIILEAQELGRLLKWSKRLTVEDRAEFDRLVADGHLFVEGKRHYQTELVETAVRNTVLYRTLLHELGHLAHYYHAVLNELTRIILEGLVMVA